MLLPTLLLLSFVQRLITDRSWIPFPDGWAADITNRLTDATNWLASIQGKLGLPDISQLPPGAGLGLIFAVGILTSFHCAGMCGGIALAQTAAPKADGVRQGFLARLKPSLPYHAGRILSYSAIGALAGGLGQVIRLPGVLKGAIPVFGGLFMIIMGINLLGIWRFLRKLNLRMPAFAARKLLSGVSKPGPLAVGLLSGLMPCGPLQIMQLYALASGSVWQGFISLLVFSLGTAPMLLLFSSIHAVTSKAFANTITRFSAIIVIVLGGVMLTRGLALSGITTPTSIAVWETAGIAAIGQGGREQIVRTALDPNHRDSYPPIVVQKGVPVQWIFSAEKEALDSCNETVVLPEFRIERRLVAGDNIIRFTPAEMGDFVYTCWMGMIKSRIQVVDDLEAYKAGQAKRTATLAVDAAGAASPVSAETTRVPAVSAAPAVPAASLTPAPDNTHAKSAGAHASTAAPAPAPATEAPVATPPGLSSAVLAPPVASSTLLAPPVASTSSPLPPAPSSALPVPPASPAADASPPPLDDSGSTVQTVITTVSPNGYTPITVQRGIPVKWIIRAKAEDLNECNNAITAPAFGLEAKLAAGDTVLEFTPSATGEFPFTCWMDMIKSTITVVEQGG